MYKKLTLAAVLSFSMLVSVGCGKSTDSSSMSQDSSPSTDMAAPVAPAMPDTSAPAMPDAPASDDNNS